MLRGSMSSMPVNILLLSLLLVVSVSLCFSYGSFTQGCSQIERDALLKFKHDLKDPSNRLASWAGFGGDCCAWRGVICDNVTGHVIELRLRSISFEDYLASSSGASTQYEDYLKLILSGRINPSLVSLKHLRYLDLRNNDFGGAQIPKFIGLIGSLKHLDLSDAGFAGMIPHELGNLSDLHYLNLHDYYSQFNVENLNWLSQLSSLEFLDLSLVHLGNVFNWLEVINTLPSLVELRLSYCQLPPVPPILYVNFSSLSILDLSSNYVDESAISMLNFPRWVSHLKTLLSLNLANNNFQGPIPNVLQNSTLLKALDLSINHFSSSIPEWLYGFNQLKLLNLRSNNLQGVVSSAIGNMTSLISLDLSLNHELKFEGGIPGSFKKLCNLRTLSLSNVKLNQDMAEVLEVLLGCVSEEVESLDLSGCLLFGQLTNHLGKFRNLAYLGLRSNSILGPIPMALGELVSLRSLHLSDNKLNGTLPKSFGELTKLEEMDISHNSFQGEVSEVHFANLKKLRNFSAAGNQLNLRVSPDWIPPQLVFIDLRSWNVGPQFPKWVRPLEHLSYLDIFNSSISSTIPIWFWTMSFRMEYLNLSHNQIQGVIPSKLKLDFTASYPLVDLSSNHFKGPLPSIFSNVGALDLSNNSFSGSMLNFLCHKIDELKNVQVLNLGENLLSGEIPDCWSSWQYLVAIKLSNNKFSGNIPDSVGALSLLESLHIRNSSLSVGSMPAWIGKRFSSMVVLNMRANKFRGRIPRELCNLASLQILDLAHNRLSWSIPTCFNKLSAMATRNDSLGKIYLDSGSSTFDNVLLVMKGKVVEYSTILKFVRSIDLSSNALCGEIPEEVTRLGELQSLNLSQNSLTGRIPEGIGSIRYLESMDFSVNQLSGEIPQSMSDLTFLSHLNLSDNRLRGRIPSGTQLQSFGPSSFSGNELCGPPLSKNCSVDNKFHVEHEREEDGNGLKGRWFYVSMVLGFIVGFWGVVGPLMFNRRWRYVYYHFLDRLRDQIWWRFM
ncbi:PREDICTED: receptor-like protein 12 [Populus euphratica]|uniref:Receptor-like protein 12 n=1 Tax=Populus euphratica TaxID=75702 RepID=A0AAJ6TZV3_POPEU|nr:PREDICTED: receptor-like protein 12 [Populus euphratica]